MKTKTIKEKPPREPPSYFPPASSDEIPIEDIPPNEVEEIDDEAPKRFDLTKQYTCFSLITYLPEDDMWLELQAHSKHIKRYAYACHDKDVWVEDAYEYSEDHSKILTNENGEPIIKHHKGERKEPHIHLILQLTQPRYVGAVRKWFQEYHGENTLCQPCYADSLARTWKYLIHDTAKAKKQGKVIYDPSIRKSNDFPYFNRFDLPFNGDSCLNALLDLEAGFTIRECCMKYGRDFIINFHKIIEVLGYINAQDERK